jgi:hypothetical protein
MTGPLRRPAVPSSCRDLDLERAARAIVAADGSIAVAAKKLGVPTTDLRMLTLSVASLDAAVSEGLDQALDLAWRVIFEGLKDPDLATRAKAASAMLRASPHAWRRGFGRGATIEH